MHFRSELDSGSSEVCKNLIRLVIQLGDTEESRHGSQVYTSIQILARDVKCFTSALCEQVDWHSGATGRMPLIA